MVVTTVRHRIFEYVKRARLASPREIGRALNMTVPSVRHHLTILVADGRVVVSALRKGTRGRPVKLYSLSPSLAGDNLAGLLDAALIEWLAALDEAARTSALESIGRRLAGAVAGNGPSVAKRLAAAVEKLKSLHYDARWEAGAEGPRLIFGRCPYAAVIDGHPELCQMDAAMIEAVFQARVVQKAKLHPVCIFAILQG